MKSERLHQGRCGLLVTCVVMSLHAGGALSRSASANLVWENNGFSNNQAILDGSSVTASNGTTITFGRNEFSDNDGGTFDLTPGNNNDYATFNSGQLGRHRGFLELSFDNEDNDPADYVEFSLNFNHSVSNLQFSLLDVDGTGNYDDAVEVYYNGSNNVRDNPGILAVSGPYNIPDLKPYMHGWEGIGLNAGNGQTFGNIFFDFGSIDISSLTVRFLSTDDPRSNPQAQQMGISDLTFVEAVPEASSLGCMAVFATMVTLIRLRRRRRVRRSIEAPVELKLFTGEDEPEESAVTEPDLQPPLWIIPYPALDDEQHPLRIAA